MSTFFIFLIFIPVLVIILLILNLFLSEHKPYSEKVATYECGFEPVGEQTRSAFNIKFFLIALLFMVFDVEIILYAPAVLCLPKISLYGFIITTIFFSILTIGFIYEISKNALDTKNLQGITKYGDMTMTLSSNNKNITYTSKIKKELKAQFKGFFYYLKTSNIIIPTVLLVRIAVTPFIPIQDTELIHFGYDNPHITGNPAYDMEIEQRNELSKKLFYNDGTKLPSKVEHNKYTFSRPLINRYRFLYSHPESISTVNTQIQSIESLSFKQIYSIISTVSPPKLHPLSIPGKDFYELLGLLNEKRGTSNPI